MGVRKYALGLLTVAALAVGSAALASPAWAGTGEAAKAIDFWPDAEKAVKGQQYVQNGNLTASGGCDGRGEHYTYTSTATGASGSQVESGRAVLC